MKLMYVIGLENGLMISMSFLAYDYYFENADNIGELADVVFQDEKGNTIVTVSETENFKIISAGIISIDTDQIIPEDLNSTVGIKYMQVYDKSSNVNNAISMTKEIK